ncbi:MAG: GGDEF domain-containing protein [Fibrobacteria bacterium]|nr:GGDEF domain-containing protein [Fibrobacteria bacterium]
MGSHSRTDIGVRRSDWLEHGRKLSFRYEDRSSDLVELLSAADELVGAPDIDTLLRRAVEIARDRIGLERVALYVEDDSGRVMNGTWGTDLDGRTTDERHYSYAKGEPEEKAHHLMDEGCARWLVIEDAPLMASEDGGSRMVRRGWLALTPIRSVRGPIGLLFNDTASSGMPIDVAKQELAAILCSLVASIVERKRVEEQLLRRSMYDGPTGLPSQALFLDRLHRRAIQADRDDGGFAVVALSLDRWTTISESYSPHVYESFLSLVAQRLLHCLRPGDTASRLSTNEFALLLDPIDSEEEAESLAQRLIAALSRPMLVEGEEIITTASAGVALSDDGHPISAEEHLQNARAALAKAKNTGTARCSSFSPSDRDLLVRSYRLEHDLHQAVENGDFLMHYQPLVRLDTGALHGFESLVRWIHPTRGMVMPGMFIPVAEENGLIRPIGEWVLSESCRQSGLWRKEHGGRSSGVTLSVNLSVRQFLQPDLFERIEKILDRTGMPPRLLHLEITESAVMEDPEQARGVLSRLKSLGLLLSLDDFGTGFSSLSYLTRLPLDILKIDRSFVMRLGHDARTEAVVRAVCDLSRDLGMEVVAEGVETTMQLEALRSFDCQYVQGYLIAKPLPPEEAGRLLAGGATSSALPEEPRNTRRTQILPRSLLTD